MEKKIHISGNGVDMYDIFLGLEDKDPELYSTSQFFWVGVIAGVYPSPPIPRRRAHSFASYPVFIFRNHLVFLCSDGYFYKIPEEEVKFIQ